MAEWIKQLGEGIKWLLSLFTSLFGVIVFRVLRGFGIKPRRR